MPKSDYKKKPYKKVHKRYPKESRMVLTKGGMFPKNCIARLRTVQIGLLTSGSLAPYFRTLTYKANSLFEIGPQHDWSGSYALNVPSGLYNLMSSNVASGSVAPYARAYIDRSSIEFKYTTQGTINTSVILAVIPSMSPTLAAITISNLNEQPYVKYVLVPPVLNTEGITIKHSIEMEELTGMKPYVAKNVQFEYTSATQDPTRLVYWHVLAIAVDGATTIYGNYIARITHNVTFFNNNVLNSGVPA